MYRNADRPGPEQWRPGRRELLATSAAIAVAAALPGRAGAAAPPPAEWPHTTPIEGGSITVYQPQATAWPNQQTLTARAAVEVDLKGKPAIFGTVEVRGETRVDQQAGIVTFSAPQLVGSHFPSLDTGPAEQLAGALRAALAKMPPRRIPLDTILLSLHRPAETTNVAVDNTPPRIFSSSRPASLVVFDGAPVLAPITGAPLSYAVNTNWDVVFDPEGKRWYLLIGQGWMEAPDWSGPWQEAGPLPAAFRQVPATADFATIHAAVPGKKLTVVPTIFVSDKPAEIIVTDGPPAFTAIPGTALRYASNANADLFYDSSDGLYYYLTSGRWFSAPGLGGPWAFATAHLPGDFARIPPSGPAGHVLASVPGTAAAQTAVIAAQIPRQATVKRSAASLTVAYVGTPEFRPIPGTSMTYAVNTTSQVIGVDGRFYACEQGVWFVAPAPTGPWSLADAIPPVIYTIPPSSPLYNVTYVQVYSATPEAVTYGFGAGYMMGFITAGLLVYGTGYYWPPVVVPGRVPAYLPYPYTYAGAVLYNPATGAWARGGAVYGPYGAARAGVAYNPATGGWARGAAVYGPYGGAGAWSRYNPSTGTYAHGSAAWSDGYGSAHGSFYNPRYGVAGTTEQNANPYARWGSSTVSGPDRTVNTASASNARGSAGAFSSSTGAEGAAVHGANGNSAAVARGRNGDVYAGNDGNVYRHTDSGWSKWDNGSWNQVQQPQRTGQYETRQPQQAAPAARSTDWDQLRQDQQARSYGDRYGGGYGGGRFGGGGGRFRR
jgi:hypothetical protein